MDWKLVSLGGVLALMGGFWAGQVWSKRRAQFAPCVQTTQHKGAVMQSSHAVLPTIAKAVLPVWIRQIDAARQHSEKSVADLLDSFALISQQVDMLIAAASLGEAGSSLQNELERVAVSLQSHDRLSQILNAVTDDIQKLVLCVNGDSDEGLQSPEDWLQRLEASYTMEEMNATHHEREPGKQSSGVQYF